MTKVSFNVPHEELSKFLEYMRKFPSKEVSICNDFAMGEDVVGMLDESSAIPLENCISRNKLEEKLRDVV